jgi:NAD(P)-dependent dehydrogenase (short-subunit alcohol dehydrogenase family)
MERFAGKVALITGGNSGIGFAVARRLASEGARVLISGRNQATIDAAVRELGSDALGIVADVGQLGGIEQLFERVQEATDRLDVLFLNAGIAIFAPVEQIDQASYDQLMDVNVKGTFFTLQRAIPLLRPGSAVVINGSVAGSTGSALLSVYAATKAAVRSFARSFSAELVERGIRVNVVSPGPIETPIWDRTGGVPAPMVPALKDSITQSHPMKRYGSADEVAAAVAFLASDEASYILGAELFVDGGVAQL